MRRSFVGRKWHSNWLLAAGLLTVGSGCDDSREFARVFIVDSMAQTIGGPAAAGRPGDFMLENDRIRAVIHGRHNARSTFPLTNGSLVDIDVQRPQERFGVGKGRDVFYELGPMVNLQVNSARAMQSGPCGSIGAAPCPDLPAPARGDACARVSASGPGESFIGFVELLNFTVRKPYVDPATPLEIVTDYDLCPGERLIRITTTARFSGRGEALEMDSLAQQAGVLDVLLGEHSGVDCARCTPGATPCAQCPAEAPHCDNILSNVAAVALPGAFRRCRADNDKLAGVLGGDFMLFAAKARVFIPGSGFDNETYIRDLFDRGGDIFSQPLSLDWVTASGDDVSYVYFSEGKAMIPVFAASFTAAMTHRLACPRDRPDCLAGKELRFQRFVGVGDGDVASALESLYRARGTMTGRIEGHVVDPRTREPISRIDVFAFRLPSSWTALSPEQIAAKPYSALVAANRESSRSPELPDGDQGLVSQFRTDIGLDDVRDGSFSGSLPPGRYVLIARDESRASPTLRPVTVEADRSHSLTLLAGDTARLDFELRDSAGNPLPAKLTIGNCFPECARDADCTGEQRFCDTASQLCAATPELFAHADLCREDQRWNGTACVCRDRGLLPLELGGSRFADGTIATVMTAGGRGSVLLPPGDYQVVASRGIEYEIARHKVTLRAGSAGRYAAALPRVVNTQGWITADFHVHGPNSVDSSLLAEPRVTSYAAEGVELLTSTDHDQRTDYRPTVFALGLNRWLRTQVGQEASPLDFGHFLGFPLHFDENAELNGAFHWREQFADNASPDWVSLPPKVIFDRLRESGAFGPERTVVAVAHFYDHFDFYDVDPWSLKLPDSELENILAITNPALSPLNFSGEFDALEVLNGKTIDVIRRPTFREVGDYNQKLARIFSDPTLDRDGRQRTWRAASIAAQREFLIRDRAEQQLAIAFDNPDFECRCSADAECGPRNLCDGRTGACIASCADDTDCDIELVQQARERCVPLEAANPTRRTCQRVAPACASDIECTATFGRTAESCLAVGGEMRCEIPCGSDRDCADDDLRRICDAGRCQAKPVPAAGDNAPCPPLGGTVDDWFQMLNHGVRRTLLGNSDSHSLYTEEAGVPRSFVRSQSDQPRGIQLAELADAVKAGQVVASYGPFIEFTLNDKQVGEVVTTSAGQAVSMRIRVQSPRWFDVDRLEIYKNGQLWQTVVDCEQDPTGPLGCVALPNNEVLNYDRTLTDTPDRDSWYVVIAMGVNGKTLAPVYSSTPVARIGLFELVQRLIPLLPPLRALRTPFSPTISVIRPYAITNPIWVDVGGDGLTPLEPPPSWATARDAAAATAGGTQQSGLRTAPDPGDHAHPHPGGDPGDTEQPGSAHDHRRGLGRVKRDQQATVEAVRSGNITIEIIRRALDGLRHLH